MRDTCFNTTTISGLQRSLQQHDRNLMCSINDKVMLCLKLQKHKQTNRRLLKTCFPRSCHVYP